MALSGWEPLHDSARHYTDPAGNIVSRRTFENARAQSIGLKNYDTARKWLNERAKEPQYNAGLKARAKATGQSQSQLRRLDSDFNRQYRKTFFHPDGSKKQSRRLSRSPKGPLSRYLEYIGVRRPNSPNRPGES